MRRAPGREERPALFDVTAGHQAPSPNLASPPPVAGVPEAGHGVDAATASHIEWRIGSPLAAAAVDAALRTPNRLAHQRPGEGEPAQPGGPVNWYAMSDDEYEDTWGAFVDFLTWALAHWSFTTEHIPARCWWLHPDIVEELTGWWGLWQVCVRDPTASAGDQMSFQERTFALKQRLEHSYRGRCRHDHVPTPALTLTAPPTHTEPG